MNDWDGQERRNFDMHEMRTDIKEIKAMVAKTNGRVTALEIWRSFILGAFAVVMTFIFPIAFQLFSAWAGTIFK